MAKKFGKVLFLTAAVASAAAGVYIYLRKRDAAQNDLEEEDYDDLSEETEKDADASRNYVPLNHDASAAKNAENTEGAPEAAQPADENSGETSNVEEFPIGKTPEAENASSSAEKASEDAPDKEKTFTPLTEQVTQAAEKTADTVEEFFDEEDGPDEEPPINDN